MYLKKVLNIISLIFVAVFLIASFFFSPTKNEVRKDAYNSDVEFEVFGVVSDVYNDKNEHHDPKIIIATSKGKKEVVFQFDKSGLFEFVQIGDSLTKEANSKIIKVYRKDKFYYFTLDYGIGEK